MIDAALYKSFHDKHWSKQQNNLLIIKPLFSPFKPYG